MFIPKINYVVWVLILWVLPVRAQLNNSPNNKELKNNVPLSSMHNEPSINSAAVKAGMLLNNIAGGREDSAHIRSFFNMGLTSLGSYKVLSGLCNGYPKRLAGSRGADGAIAYMMQQLKEAGADTVYLQPVMVPHWVRGKVEKCTFRNKDLAVTTLGGSVATPPGGIYAGVVEIHSYDELKTRNVKGKIVFYNVPFDNTEIETFRSYGKAVGYRGNGAIMAAKYGAVATIVRSMASNINNYPHTGAMHYADTVVKIPSGAISTFAADELHKLLMTNDEAGMHLTLDCKTLPDTLQYNVIGELRGTDKNAGVIIAGGHLDAWETGDGAHDDGAGCAHSVEVMRLLSLSGLRLAHTLRIVLFMNEENGLRGGNAQNKYVREHNEKVVAALETDAGGFTPRGFEFGCPRDMYKKFESYKNMFSLYGCSDWDWSEGGSGGADIGPLKGAVPLLIEFRPDSQRYFDVHHAATDNLSSVSPRELEMGACCIAGLIYVLDKTL